MTPDNNGYSWSSPPRPIGQTYPPEFAPDESSFIGVLGTLALFVIAAAPFAFVGWLTWMLLQPMVERWPTLPMF